MGDLLQYLYSLEYHYKIPLKKVSNLTYLCLMYNIQPVLNGGLVASFHQEMGSPMFAVYRLLYPSLHAYTYPQERETTRHDDTRVASRLTPAANI